MAAEYNVAVLATLRNRVSQGLRFIARDFQGTERHVRSLQRAINDLQMRRDLYASTSRQRSDIERKTTADLERQMNARKILFAQGLPARQAQIASLEKEADERERSGKIAAENLKRSERASALAAVQARRAKDDVQIQKLKEDVQKRQLAITEDQALINRRNSMAQIAATERQNRLLEMQRVIDERNARIVERNAAARSAARMRALRIGGGMALAAGATAVELARAGLPVGMYLQQIRMGGHLTPQESARLPSMALRLSAQSTQFTYKEVLRALRQIIPLYGFGETQRLGPSVFALGALERQRGIGGSLAEMSLDTLQTIRTLHARTPAQQQQVINALTGMMFGAGVSPEQFNQTLRTIGVSTTTLPFAERLRAGTLTEMIMAAGGSQVGLTPSGIGDLFKALLTPRLGSHMGLIQLLNRHHLPLTGPNAIDNIIKIIQQTPRGLSLAQRFLSGREFNELIALRNQLHGPMLQRLQAMHAMQMDPQMALAKSLQTAEPAMRKLGVALDNFVTILGTPIAKRAGHAAGYIADQLERGAKIAQGHGLESKLIRDEMFGGLPRFLFQAASQGYKNLFGPSQASGIGTNQLMGDLIHLTLNIDGRHVYDGMVKNTTRQLKQSVMSNTRSRGPVTSPHVYPGSRR